MRAIQRMLLCAVAVCFTTAQGQAAIVGVAGGPAAPSATLGPYTMTPFGVNPLPDFTDVTSIDSPLGGVVTSNIPVNLRTIGNSWGTWSHNYAGQVYSTNGSNSVTLTLPAQTGAFYLYAESNPFAVFSATATANDGTTITQNVDGNGGAAYFGFYATPGGTITSVTISMVPDFAFGEFGIAAAVPEPSSLALIGIGAVVAGVGAARQRRREKR